MQDIFEALGDSPEWMRIHSYVQDKRGHKSELILELGERRKKYWFPMTPQVYRRFSYKIGESRLKGLKYLQAYIRRYRDYSGWGPASYVEKNRIKQPNSLTVNVLRMYNENNNINDVSKALNLSESLVREVVVTYGALAV